MEVCQYFQLFIESFPDEPLFQENIYHHSSLCISGETYDASRIKISREDIEFITPIAAVLFALTFASMPARNNEMATSSILTST
jgi:hypothetical protein